MQKAANYRESVVVNLPTADEKSESWRGGLWASAGSTAATHDLRTGKRGFNEEYATLMAPLGIKPRTIGIGEKEQNVWVDGTAGSPGPWARREATQLAEQGIDADEVQVASHTAADQPNGVFTMAEIRTRVRRPMVNT